MIFSFWRKWHPRVNKWDGMRPKSPNSIHRAWLLCHIPPIRAMSGAKSYLANPMGFAVTLTSPSCPLSSPRLHLLATYHCVGFRERLYHSPSSLSIACVLHSSSLFVVGIYSLILQCKSPFAIAYANIELCLNNPSMPHLCTSHHLETQLQFPLPSVLFTGICCRCNCWCVVCYWTCLLFWFNILCPLPILWCTTNLLLLVICGFPLIIMD